MGTQIRKGLGYALTDVVPDDLRIKWDSPLLDIVGINPTFGDFVKHLEATGPFEDPEFEDVDMVRAGFGEPTAYRLGSCVVHSFDYGLPNVMALVPPSYVEAPWAAKPTPALPCTMSRPAHCYRRARHNGRVIRPWWTAIHVPSNGALLAQIASCRARGRLTGAPIQARGGGVG